MEDLDVAAGSRRRCTWATTRSLTIADVPPLVTGLVDSATGLGPYHAKAIGEGPNTPARGGIANAVYDACGVRMTDPPITAEKVWRGLRARRIARLAR